MRRGAQRQRSEPPSGKLSASIEEVRGAAMSNPPSFIGASSQNRNHGTGDDKIKKNTIRSDKTIRSQSLRWANHPIDLPVSYLLIVHVGNLFGGVEVVPAP